jgi:FkbM family methyltransferase
MIERMRPYYYLGGRRGMTQLANGQPFIVNTEARDIATWIIQSGVWESHVDDILCALVRPQDTVFDIGANMGYYTVKLGGALRGGGHIYSFEPNPDLFEVLEDNANINGFADRATLFRCAVGHTAGQFQFGFDRRYPGGGQVGGMSDVRETIEIQMVRIDDVIPADCVADLIKIDVEGFEPLAFQGMTALLARSPGAAIVMEASYQTWAQYGLPSEVLQELAGDRQMFQILHDGRLEEVSGASLDAALKLTAASYLLLLPRSDERAQKLAQFRKPDYRGAHTPRTPWQKFKARLAP